MENPFRTFVATCTRSLADDEAMRREVAFELNNHLDEAYEEELAKAGSPEEVAEMAKKRFGQPEELAVQLLNANIKRFSFRARMRRLLKIAFIPLLILGVILCLDLRFWGSLVVCDRAGVGSWGIPPVISDMLLDLIYSEELRSTSPARELLASQFADTDYPSSIAAAEALYKFDPASKVYTAYYAQQLAMHIPGYRKSDDADFDQFCRVIAHGRKIDPDNALYDYLEAYVIAGLSMQTAEQDFGNGKYTISDRAGLDKAMNIYLAGTRKPFIRTYNLKIAEEAYNLLPDKTDLLWVFQRIAVYSYIELPYLSMFKSLTRNVIFYAENLTGEDAPAGEELLASWEYFLPQALENNESLIDVLVCGSIADMYLEAIQKRDGDSPTLARMAAVVRDWRSARDANATIKEKYKPLLSRNFLIKGDYKLPVEYFIAENRMCYSLLDQFALLPLCIVLILLTIVFAVIAGISRLKGRKPFIIILPWRSYCKIFLAGIILPLVLFLLYTHIDWLSGRDIPVAYNLRHIGVEKFLFVVFSRFVCGLWPGGS